MSNYRVIDYYVWCPDLGEDAEYAVIVRAQDEERAVEFWAERKDAASGDYWIVNSSVGTVVHVRGPDCTTNTWRVTGMQTIIYSAQPEE